MDDSKTGLPPEPKPTSITQLKAMRRMGHPVMKPRKRKKLKGNGFGAFVHTQKVSADG